MLWLSSLLAWSQFGDAVARSPQLQNRRSLAAPSSKPCPNSELRDSSSPSSPSFSFHPGPHFSLHTAVASFASNLCLNLSL
ncbi:hypothetical protein IWZ01DRAFT_494339 [Phyllosticta capitalensis]